MKDTINPGDTMNIGSDDHLIQIQHKGDHIDIVDHHKDFGYEHPHTITHIDRDGNIDSETR
jgi:hypothetical protein